MQVGNKGGTSPRWQPLPQPFDLRQKPWQPLSPTSRLATDELATSSRLNQVVSHNSSWPVNHPSFFQTDQPYIRVGRCFRGFKRPRLRQRPGFLSPLPAWPEALLIPCRSACFSNCWVCLLCLASLCYLLHFSSSFWRMGPCWEGAYGLVQGHLESN